MYGPDRWHRPSQVRRVTRTHTHPVRLFWRGGSVLELDVGAAPTPGHCDDNMRRPGHSEGLSGPASCQFGCAAFICMPCKGLMRGYLFVNKSAREDSGAIYGNRGRLQISECAFTGNQAVVFQIVACSKLDKTTCVTSHECDSGTGCKCEARPAVCVQARYRAAC